MSVWLWWSIAPGFETQSLDVEMWRKRFQEVPEEIRDEVIQRARQFYRDVRKVRG